MSTASGARGPCWWLQGQVGQGLPCGSTDLLLGGKGACKLYLQKAYSSPGAQDHWEEIGNQNLLDKLEAWPERKQSKTQRDNCKSSSSAGASSCTNTAGQAGAAGKGTWIRRQSSCCPDSKRAACKAREGTRPPLAPAGPLLDGALREGIPLQR